MWCPLSLRLTGSDLFLLCAMCTRGMGGVSSTGPPSPGVWSLEQGSWRSP